MVSGPAGGATSLPRVRRALPAAGFLMLAVVVMLGICPATAGGTDGDSYDVRETLTITVDELGNARYTDVLVYNPEFFHSEGIDFDKYPNVLTRRYRQKMSIDSIQSFKHSIDRAKSTITLTFRQAGRAYNHGDRWVLYGFSHKPSGGTGVTRVFERESTVNSEFTLGRSLDFWTKTIVKLPATAMAVRWDEKDGALLYEVPYAMATAPGGSALQENRGVFIPVFVVLMLASAAAVVGVLLRRPAWAAADSAPALAGGAGSATAGALAPETSSPSYYVPPATETQATVAIRPEASVSVETPAAAPSAITPAAPQPAAPPAAPVVAAPAALEGERDATALVGQGDAPSVEPAPPTKAPAHEEGPMPHFCQFCGAGLPGSGCRFCPSCGQQLAD